MRPAHALLIVALILLRPGSTLGQTVIRELHGELFSVEGSEYTPKFFPNVKVIIREFGISGLTDDQGRFRIKLPPGVLPGQEVAIRHDKKGYAICSPLFGKQLIPADSTKVVEVRMLPEGSKLFWTHQRIEEFIEHTANESAKQLKRDSGEDGGPPDYVLELARHYGFTPDDVRREIARWMESARKDTTDFRRQGMVAFAEKKFRLAGENFRRGAEHEERQAAEKLRKSAELRELSGDSFYSASDYRDALEEFRLALDSLNRYRASLGDLKLKTYPEYDYHVMNISCKLANTKTELGTQVHGPGGRQHLEEAIQDYNRLITTNLKSSNPRGWSAIQNNLGTVLVAQGVRLDGAEAIRKLAEATAVYRQALTVRTRDDTPQQWAGTLNNLGAALAAQGQRLGGPEGARKLAEATDAITQAFIVFTRDDTPHQWSATLNNLGIVLAAQGMLLDGAEGARKLAEAAAAYRQTLTVYTGSDLPQRWAMTQYNLGTTLQVLVAVHGLPGCLEHVGSLTRDPAIRDDPASLTPLHALAVVCHAGMGQNAETRRVLADLVALVERQPDDFRLAWNWDRLRDFITGSKAEGIKVHRELLLGLIDAVSQDDREAILAGLNKIK